MKITIRNKTGLRRKAVVFGIEDSCYGNVTDNPQPSDNGMQMYTNTGVEISIDGISDPEQRREKIDHINAHTMDVGSVKFESNQAIRTTDCFQVVFKNVLNETFVKNIYPRNFRVLDEENKIIMLVKFAHAKGNFLIFDTQASMVFDLRPHECIDLEINPDVKLANLNQS